MNFYTNKKINQITFLLIGFFSLSIVLAEMSSLEESEFPFIEAECCRLFSSKLYQIITQEIEGNVISSPLSIHVLLSFLSHGARGKTATEMLDGLDVKDLTQLHINYKTLISSLNLIKNSELRLANAVFLHHHVELLTEFTALGTEYYNFTVPKIDFTDSIGSAKQINDWVLEKTNQKIRDIISSDDISDDLKVVLVNAIYFKGRWKYPFESRQTSNRIFHENEQVRYEIPTMKNQKRYSHGELPELNAKFLEMPYTDDELSMVIILPNEINGLAFLEKNFNWDTVVNANKDNHEVDLYLPKFKIECTINLKEILRKVGFSAMFEDIADFSGMAETPLKVSKVLQKAFIEVNESGTEAAVATAMQIRLKRMIHEPDEFIVDRPFMAVIHHKPSNVPLFIGSVRRIEVNEKVEKDEL